MNEIHVPSKNEILEAADQLRQIVIKTPLLPFRVIEQRLNAKDIKIKAESMQWTGSFKFRGAFWRCKQLTEAEQKKGVIATLQGILPKDWLLQPSSWGFPQPL